VSPFSRIESQELKDLLACYSDPGCGPTDARTGARDWRALVDRMKLVTYIFLRHQQDPQLQDLPDVVRRDRGGA
jgi:hypothetical protein